MKRKVDLTQRHIFSGGTHSRSFHDLSLIQRDCGFPWELREPYMAGKSDEDLLLKPIRTGTASEREAKRLIAVDLKATMGEVFGECPRCGKDMLPWQRPFGLCSSCLKAVEDTLSNGSDRWPWAPKRNLLGDTDDRVVLELNSDEELNKPF